MPPFIIPDRVEIAYRTAISDMIRKILPKKKEDMSLDEWLRHLVDLSHHADIVEMATSIASRMVSWVNVENKRSWREASQESQRSQMLYSLLQKELEGPVGKRFNALVATQSNLLLGIPQDVALRLQGTAASLQQRGARPEAIAGALIMQFPAFASSRIKLLARTGASSASTLLTEARCEELDIEWAQWYTSKDIRVRPSHRNMDGVLFAWDDLPSPEALIHQKPTLGRYAPGNCPNCRCGPLPILTLEDVFKTGSERVRVYRHGSIHLMTRSQFAKISQIESRMAA